MAYKLTPLGDNRALNLASVDPESAIVVFLYQMKDPVEIEEIAGETRLQDEQALRVVNRLISTGYVKEV